MKPDSGIEMYSTGIPARAQSIRFCEVTSLHLSGAVGQQEKIVSGLAFRSFSVERTGDHRLLTEQQTEVETIAVLDLFRHILTDE